MEQIASQKILLPIIPWFLEKYKPWTAKEAVVEHLYLGRNPPMFTEMRALSQCYDDDHLVLELGMNFLTAEDMSAILAVKLRKRLGFGMWAKLHITSMHVEGKVLVGVKFLRQWPFLGRLRVCFAEPPYFQMTVKPIFTHGVDVTELPGIAGWLDKLLSIAFEQTLVEPNMLVVDIEKFASPQPENWFFVDEKEPIAYAKVEVVEASDMKPSDLNGLADPYVKGQLGPYRFRTGTQKKTLAPKWNEEFKIPICTWDSPNVLAIEVCDKDRFVDDTLGKCTVNISDLRGGQRHDMWLPLQNIKTGRLHLVVTVDNAKGNDYAENGETLKKEDIQNSSVGDTADKEGPLPSVSSDKSAKVPDNFEPINIEGQEKTGIWIHQPGSEVSQTWEPRKGKSRSLETVIYSEPKNSFESTTSTASGSPPNDNSSADENLDGKHPGNRVRKGIWRIFRRSPKKDDQSSGIGEVFQSAPANLRAVNAKKVAVKFVVDDNLPGPSSDKGSKEGSLSPEGSGPKSQGKNMKGMAKSVLKHAGNSARTLKHVLSRKGSKDSRTNASEMTEQNICEESEFSNDESVSSFGTESLPHPMSLPRDIDDSCNTTKHAVETNSSAQVDPLTNTDDQIERISIECPKERDDDKMRSPGKPSSGLVESPKLKPSEGSLEGEKM
ncbi:hypothetical protein SLEP1_g16372 [Rubroshorea leprosula]|uniref:C2 domain-containing protein n=1 Tax=Rubroshorea leprosula TaxID=152421 RepID=A0AAV5IQN9_9ROSI|nr:hypothetical protein SLEP1_g16372 [Rubroshorea leprosula]